MAKYHIEIVNNETKNTITSLDADTVITLAANNKPSTKDFFTDTKLTLLTELEICEVLAYIAYLQHFLITNKEGLASNAELKVLYDKIMHNIKQEYHGECVDWTDIISKIDRIKGK